MTFHRIGPLARIELVVKMSGCIIMSPPLAKICEGFNLPSDHMISPRPFIGQPSFPTSLLPPPHPTRHTPLLPPPPSLPSKRKKLNKKYWKFPCMFLWVFVIQSAFVKIFCDSRMRDFLGTF